MFSASAKATVLTCIEPQIPRVIIDRLYCDCAGEHTHGVAADVDIFAVVHKKPGAAAFTDIEWQVLAEHLRSTQREC